VLVEADGAESLRSAYVEFAERPDHYSAVAEEKRRLVLRSVLASDVERLTSLLVQICAHRRQSRDFTRVELREALREVLIHAPAYRSYVAVREDGVERTLNDLNYVDLAIARAREARADLDGDLFDLLRTILLGELGLPEAVELARWQLEWVGRGKGDGMLPTTPGVRCSRPTRSAPTLIIRRSLRPTSAAMRRRAEHSPAAW
jgi:(1->4)-alpha-D-glucan 1-alpha-D-glucosylmutase